MTAQQNRTLIGIGAIIAVALVVIALILARVAIFPPLTNAQRTATMHVIYQTIGAGLEK